MDLEQTIGKIDCDTVILATPRTSVSYSRSVSLPLEQVVKSKKTNAQSWRIYYEIDLTNYFLDGVTYI
jgi:hypothetical protein